MNSALYDYTLLRVAATELTGGWVNATDAVPPAETKVWIYAWCQALSETINPACTGDVFAMGDDSTAGVMAGNCTDYSGGGYADFNGVALSLQTVSYFDPANGATAELEGVQLQYTGSDVTCAENPLKKTSFNINIFCDPDTIFDYNPIADVTDPCAPVVQVIS